MRSRYALLHPRFVLLACGQATSSLGNGVFPVAIACLVLERGSATDFAVVLAADGVGLIVVIAGAGLLADRLPRIGLMVAADVLRLAATGAMAVVPSALQRNVPDDVLGRVVAVDYLGSDGLTPVGTALTGPVVDRAGANPVMLAAIAVIAVTSAAVVRVPEAMSLGHSAGDERPARQASPRAKA